MMNKDSRIYVAGHTGMVGGAIVRHLVSEGYTNIITRTHSELDLTDKSKVREFFLLHRPEYVFLCAAKVGGILANNRYRYDFIYNNIMISANVIDASREFGVTKLINMGSSCIYPKDAPQPMRPEHLLTSPLEETNEPYAIAKIASVKMCENSNRQYDTEFISVMPTNLYGIGDTYDDGNSHVIPALISRFHKAKVNNQPVVEVWGDGTTFREFLFADDLADACVFIMNEDLCEYIINIGSNEEISIHGLVNIIKEVVGYTGDVEYIQGLTGPSRKLLDSSDINRMGWKSTMILENGIHTAYEDYKKRYCNN